MYLLLVALGLCPPPVVRGVYLLLELNETYNNMMVPTFDKKWNLDPMITTILDPIIQICELAIETQKCI